MDKPEQNKKRSIRLTPATAIVGAITAFLLGQVLGGVAVWLSASALDSFTSLFILDSWFESTEAQFLLVLLSGIITLFLLWFFMRRLRAGWREVGLERKRPKWSDLGYALMGAPVYFALLIAAGTLAGIFLGVNLEQEQEIGFNQVITSSDRLLALISLVVIPPIVEELLFRGFLFTGLRSKLNFAATAVIVSALFALPHIFATSDGLLWIAAIDTFVLSLVLCYLREKTASLWAPIFLHALKNGAAFLFLFA